MAVAAANATLTHYANAAGADEAGRGPLAGPVVAAAVILPDGFDLNGIGDSKKLTAKQRTTQEARIKEAAIWAVEVSPIEEVDRLNILHASLAAMARAIARLSAKPSLILIDGNKLPPGLDCEARAVVKGDGSVACIAAASILAKVERDRIMCGLAAEYPDYGFDVHFGYATASHIEALLKFGPCPIHRRSFLRIQGLLQPGFEGFEA